MPLLLTPHPAHGRAVAVFNIFIAFVGDAVLARFEAAAEERNGGISSTEAHLESLRKAYNEPGYEVVAATRHRSDQLLKQMFADELDEVLEKELRREETHGASSRSTGIG